jgi:hypothetical protein
MGHGLEWCASRVSEGVKRGTGSPAAPGRLATGVVGTLGDDGESRDGRFSVAGKG